ncbi:hypothetical protein HDC33_002683 [Sporosarcina sp. JAI121]|nr:hypothetical protein [Sporosarcina sp. JAI121]
MELQATINRFQPIITVYRPVIYASRPTISSFNRPYRIDDRPNTLFYRS